MVCDARSKALLPVSFDSNDFEIVAVLSEKDVSTFITKKLYEFRLLKKLK